MKLLDLRKQAKSRFRALGIDEVDADFIIAETLNLPHTSLIMIDEISTLDAKKIEKNLKKREQRIPVNRIFNHACFYGLDFKINKNVLAPRQDSEILVDECLKLIKAKGLKSALDVCTGSGCLAVALAKNAGISVCASDISQRALSLATVNAESNAVKINFIKSNMFSKIDGKFDLILSNPPYICSHEIASLDDEVKFQDPLLALDGGEDGLKFYKIIAKHAPKHLNKNGYVCLEIGATQREQVLRLFKDYDFVDCVKDYAGKDRVMIFKLRSEK